MKLNKRLADLEARHRRSLTSFDHLSDKDLDAYALDLIARIGTEGVALPDDWQDQYRRSEIMFLGWLEGEVREAIACAA